MNDKKLIGREGEAEAARYLKSKGYKVIGLNWACRFGEIDVIAEKDGYIVFAEVKTRKSADFAAAMEFVTAAKRERLRSAASMYLQSHDTEKQPRFDVIEIYTGGAKPAVNHIENAFE